MLRNADRIRDTSTTTGAGNFVVSGSPPSSFKTFSDIPSIATNDTFWYSIVNQSADEWEVGLGTWQGTNTFSRTTIYSSSNGGLIVTFSAGTKDVFCTLPQSQLPAIGGSSGQYQYNSSGSFAGIGLILFADTTFYVRYNLGTVTMTIASPCVVSKTAHGLSNDDPVVFSTSGALPTNLTAGTVYYVVNKNTDDFQVSATVGGAAINTSGSQSGTHTAATGNDSNDGSAATRAAAWLTLQHACNYMAGVDANGYGVTVQAADSTYLPASPGSYCLSIMYRPRSAEYFYILGNTTTPGNVVVDGLGAYPYGFSIGYNYDTSGIATVRIDRLDGFKVKDAYTYATAYGRSSAGINHLESENNSYVLECYDYSRVNMNYIAFSGTSDYAVYMDGYASGGFNNATFAASSTINYEVFNLTAYNYLTAILNDYTNLTATTDYYVGPFCFLSTSGTSGSIPGAAGTVDALGKVS
jgi:hypothetical protein